MSPRKLNISEMLIESYIKAPPLLKEQAVTKLSIQLCQNIELKKDILFLSEPLQRLKYSVKISEWNDLIEKRSTSMCEQLHLPPALENLVIVRIQTIAMQLFTWNRQQVMFDLSPLFADSLLTPSDWTVEMKLDEKKIAERLVQDERIPVCERYKMACLHCLESIHFLWYQMSIELRDDLFLYDEFKLVQLWTYKLSDIVEESLPYEDVFWFSLVKYGIEEGSKSTVINYWDTLNVSSNQDFLIGAALTAVSNIYSRIDNDVVMYLNVLASPAPYMDILCFLLTQMTKQQMVAFFQQALQDTENNILICFLHWPYMELLLPIIKELWGILPEEKFRGLLLFLANNYSDVCDSSIRINGYVDYEYGSLLIQLLKESPNNFKRYAFGNSNDTCINTFRMGELLCVLIHKEPLQKPNINIFKHVWQLVELEEKLSFLQSEEGESFCGYLALLGNWELLNYVLNECLPKNNIAVVRKKMLRSESGRETCLRLITGCNKKLLNSWLNWGFSSKKEIFQFLSKIFFRNPRFDSKLIYDFEIETNFLFNVIDSYAPSERAKGKFKSRFVKIYSKDVHAHLIFHSNKE